MTGSAKDLGGGGRGVESCNSGILGGKKMARIFVGVA